MRAEALADSWSCMATPTAYQEILNLLALEVDDLSVLTNDAKTRVLVAKTALVEWEKAVQVLEGKVERRTKRTDGLIFEIYQLVGLYTVFAGVVFTAVLQSNRVACQHIWSPIVLCLFACVVTAFVTNRKFKEIQSERSLIDTDEEARKTAFGNLRSLKARGHLEFDFLNPEHFKEKRKGSQNKRDTTRLFVIIILVFFTVVLVVSFVHIVCISKSPSTACVNALTPSSL